LPFLDVIWFADFAVDIPSFSSAIVSIQAPNRGMFSSSELENRTKIWDSSSHDEKPDEMPPLPQEIHPSPKGQGAIILRPKLPTACI
jgi:hypothetical protein